MMAILQAVLPVFAIAGLGYFIAARKLMSTRDIDGLSRFVFSIALPVLLFESMATSDAFLEPYWPFFLLFYGVSFFIFGFGLFVGRRAFSLSPAEQGLYGLGSSYSNLVLVGLPIIASGLGEAAVMPLLLLASVQNLLLFPLVSLVANADQRESRLAKRIVQSVRRVVTNPIVASLLLGMAFRLLSLQIPLLLATPIDLLGQAGIPSALFVLGASLHRYEATRLSREALTMVLIKMLLQPALVWVLATNVLYLEPLWVAVAVMAAGMPTGVNAYMLAEQMGTGQRTIAASIWVSTVFAILSQTALLAIFIGQV
jgi:malonate transporter